jgi:hypothetical protein
VEPGRRRLLEAENVSAFLRGNAGAVFRQSKTQVFVNPGLRWAVIQGPVEWVLGASVPIGLTRDAPDIGIFAYMSIEFGFRKGK